MPGLVLQKLTGVAFERCVNPANLPGAVFFIDFAGQPCRLKVSMNMDWPSFSWPWSINRSHSLRSTLDVEAFGCTARGQVRLQNEDDFHCNQSPPFFMVADGLGGLQEGALASYLAVQRAVATLRLGRGEGGWRWNPLWGPAPEEGRREAEMVLKKAFSLAHLDLTKVIERSKSIRLMGTTLSLALLDGRRLVYGNLGDSRIYHLRGSLLRCLTTDDTEAMVLLQGGAIRPREYEDHPCRNVLTRRLGGRESHEPTAGCLDLEPDDVILLCTDGLYTMLALGTIKAVLIDRNKSAEWKADMLVRLADEAGGEDNIAAVVVVVSEGSL